MCDGAPGAHEPVRVAPFSRACTSMMRLSVLRPLWDRARDDGWGAAMSPFARLAELLDSPTRHILVTGGAASGPSAFLEAAVAFSDPEVRGLPQFEAELSRVGAAAYEVQPPVGAFAVAVSAHGHTSLSLVRELASRLTAGDVPQRDEDETVDDDPRHDEATAWRDLIREAVGNRTITIALDALDEAVDPVAVLLDVVGPLGQSWSRSRPTVRFVIGLRTVAADGTHDILRHLVDPCATLELDGKSWPVGDITAPSPAGVADFHSEFAALAPDERATTWAALRATALAFGPGIPRGDVWTAVLEAVLDADVPDANRVIDSMLGGPLSALLLRDIEEGRVVYRPSSQQLAQYLRDPDAPDAATRTDPPDVQARIAERLGRLAAICPVPLHPYLRRHLVDHARAGNGVDDAILSERFLPWDTSGSVRAALGPATTPGPQQQAVAAWASIETRLSGAPLHERAASLAFARLAAEPRHADCAPARAGRWRSASNVLAVPGARVLTLCPIPLPDGRTLLAVGCKYSPIRLWDPATGQQIGDPLPDHAGRGKPMASAVLPDGRVVLACQNIDGRIWLWDLVTRTPVGDPLSGHPGKLDDLVSFRGPEGRALLASAGDDRLVRVWDPLTGALQSEFAIDGFQPRLSPLDLPGGHVGLAVGTHTGTLTVWDPIGGTPVAAAWRAHEGDVRALASVQTTEGHDLLASADDQRVRLWNPDSGELIREFGGDDSTTRSLTSALLADGRSILVAGDDNGTVRVWDVHTGARVGSPFPRHLGPARTVVTIPGLDGRPLVASGGGRDGTIRLWDPTGPLDDDGGAGKDEDVWAMATLPEPSGRSLLVTAGQHQTVRLWDVASGATVGEPLTGFTERISALATVRVPGERWVLASAGYDGAVRLWDPASATPVGAPMPSDPGGLWSLCAVTVAGGRTLVAAGGTDSYVRLWDPVTGTPVGSALGPHADTVVALAAVPGVDGRTPLAVGDSYGFVCVWDLDTAARTGNWEVRHAGQVGGLTAIRTRDLGTVLVSGGDDRTLRFWDPSTGEQLLRVRVAHKVAGLLTLDDGPHQRLAVLPYGDGCPVIDPDRVLSAARGVFTPLH